MKYFLIILLFSVRAKLCAQDIHFSQFNNAPMFINPALAGEFDGKVRFMSNYKNQWGAVSSNPYTTYGFSTDKSFYDNKLAGGISFFNDKSGDSRMSNSQATITIASKVNLNEKNYLRVGLQGGFGQRSIDVTNLSWDNQYDGKAFNTSNSSGEILQPTTFNYADVGAGIYWKYTPQKQFSYFVGIGAFHLNRPQQSFYNNNIRLKSRYTFNGGAMLHISNTNKTILPAVLINTQGPYKEIYFGLGVKFGLGEDAKKSNPSSNITAGVYYRTKDAAIIYTQLMYKSIGMGVSYDVTLSKLGTVSNSRGGFELSLVYVLDYRASRKEAEF